MNARLVRFAAIALLSFSVSASAQSVSDLNTQLQQAVDSSSWSKAIQVVDQMAIAEPKQAEQLERYRRQLQERLQAQVGPVRLARPQRQAVSANSEGLGKVAVTNALVARREVWVRDLLGLGRVFDPLVRYSLRMEVYNGTRGIAKLIHVYYDLISWNEDYNESGSFVIPDIQSDRKFYFDEPLQWRAVPQNSRNRYEGVRVRINRVDWLNEDGSSGLNDASVKFGYWGKV